jgi:hypothetical protein
VYFGITMHGTVSFKAFVSISVQVHVLHLHRTGTQILERFVGRWGTLVYIIGSVKLIFLLTSS